MEGISPYISLMGIWRPIKPGTKGSGLQFKQKNNWSKKETIFHSWSKPIYMNYHATFFLFWPVYRRISTLLSMNVQVIEEDNDEWESGDLPSNHINVPQPLRRCLEAGKVKIKFDSNLVNKGERKKGLGKMWGWWTTQENYWKEKERKEGYQAKLW